ncbi:iron chelate uptake ABC transporter family permease subunit [Rhodobacteraceae bacterium B1Z28]|uniref:Iron chelate uptake ABC transporter family permease subunit n=1 Tax=Ruegeria haliotis TaxID=2747601 RepID=A0ABX2PRG9_9RHOB|nr:iron chelate uptake ABC transporter family permease subunit [Ruegeria haliotis]NVO56738.1 iron chelate uptake ABC transporter family permease subunit [Ruegeria haliotis]
MRVRFILLTIALSLCCAAYLSIGARGDWGFVLSFRAQKLAALLLVGFSLSWATVVFQTITGNRILTPSIMGFDALYLLLLSALVWSIGAQAYQALSAQVLMTASAALLCGAALILFKTVLRAGRGNLMQMILTGVVLSVLFRSLTAYFQRVIDPNEYAVVQAASFARFSNVDTSLLLLAAVLSLGAGLAVWRIRHRLDVTSLGPVLSASLGEPPRRVQWQVLILISVLVSISTALVGPVAFFGLLVTSLTYLVTPSCRHSEILPTAALIAGIILVGGQTLMERVLDLSTPLSVVVEFIGGLIFLFLLLRSLR